MEMMTTKKQPDNQYQALLDLQEAPTVVGGQDIYSQETVPQGQSNMMMEMTTRINQVQDQYNALTNFSKLKIDDEDQTKKTTKQEIQENILTNSQNMTNQNSQSSKVGLTKSALLGSKFFLQSQQSDLTQRLCDYLGNGLFFMRNGDQTLVIHETIFMHFGEDCYENIRRNQTVVETFRSESMDEGKLDNEEQIINFLSQSKNFKHIDKIEVLAQGGEAVVYKINHAGYEEVVLKVPLSKRQDSDGYEDLIQETQLIKAVYDENYVVGIKEEIIEVDFKTGKLLRYCVIEERARYSLYDLCCIKDERGKQRQYKGYWFKQENQQNSLEKFSTEKFFFLYFQTMKTLLYLHQLGIVYSDMKPQNLLIMRNMKVKIGDFGVSILLNKEKPNQTYSFKGLTPSWCMQNIKNQYYKFQRAAGDANFFKMQWKREELMQNDIFACCICFEAAKLKKDYPSHMIQEKDNRIIEFFDVLQNQLAYANCTSLPEAINEVDQFLFQDPENYNYMNDLIHQMKSEKKYQAGFDLCDYLLKQKVFQDGGFQNENISLLKIKLIQLRGLFKFQQADYKQSRTQHQQLEEFYEKDSKQIKSPKIQQQLQSIITESRLQNAKTYLMQGHIQQGENLIKQVFSEIEDNPTLKEENKLTTLELKGQLLLSKNQFPQALPVFEEYLSLVQQKKDTRGMIFAKLNIANVYFKLHDYEKALKFYDEGSALCEGPVGKLDFEKSKGNVYVQQQEFQKAEQQFIKALKICQEVYGDKSVMTAEVYRQLADLKNHLNQQEEAVALYKKAESIYVYWYGQSSPYLAVILNNLGGLFIKQNDLARAEEYLIRALKMRLDMNNQQETADNVTLYMNLSSIKQRQNNIEAALVYFESVYQIKKTFQQFMTPEMFQTIMTYIELLLHNGKVQKANTICEEALKEFEKAHGPNHKFVIRLIILNGQIFARQEKYQQSFTCFKKVLGVISELPENPEIIKTKYILNKEMGNILEKKQDKQAITYFHEALKLIDPQNYIEKINIQQSLAVIYMKQDECQEALKQIEIAEKNYSLAIEKEPAFKNLEKEIIGPIIKLREDLKTHMEKASKVGSKKKPVNSTTNTGVKSASKLKPTGSATGTKQNTAKAPTGTGKTLKPSQSSSKTMTMSKSTKKI